MKMTTEPSNVEKYVKRVFELYAGDIISVAGFLDDLKYINLTGFMTSNAINRIYASIEKRQETVLEFMHIMLSQLESFGMSLEYIGRMYNDVMATLNNTQFNSNFKSLIGAGITRDMRHQDTLIVLCYFIRLYVTEFDMRCLHSINSRRANSTSNSIQTKE